MMWMSYCWKAHKTLVTFRRLVVRAATIQLHDPNTCCNLAILKKAHFPTIVMLPIVFSSFPTPPKFPVFDENYSQDDNRFFLGRPYLVHLGRKFCLQMRCKRDLTPSLLSSRSFQIQGSTQYIVQTGVPALFRIARFCPIHSFLPLQPQQKVFPHERAK